MKVTCLAQRRPSWLIQRLLCSLLIGAGSFGCDDRTTLHELDPDFNRMLEVPRGDPYEGNSFFEDGMVMRVPPEGTVPHAAPGAKARQTDGDPSHIPFELNEEALQRGRDRFERICAACHGVLGQGRTVVGRHMQRPPPSLHEPRILALPAHQVQRVIESGYGFMPSYASHLDATARWEVVAYLRALQLSRQARLDEMPADLALKAQEALR